MIFAVFQYGGKYGIPEISYYRQRRADGRIHRVHRKRCDMINCNAVRVRRTPFRNLPNPPIPLHRYIHLFVASGLSGEKTDIFFIYAR